MVKEHACLMPYQAQLIHNYQRYAHAYQEAALIFAEVGQRLLSRLAYVKYPPQTIADLGCGQGSDTQLLSYCYPYAEIIAVDFCHSHFAHWPQQKITNNILQCNAYATQLPFPTHYFDLVYANLLMPALLDYQSFWQEALRVLKPGGILLFSTLGPDTLIELKQSLSFFNSKDSINLFPDMHDIGDSLASAGFNDPVIDAEKIELHYSSLKKLLAELKHLGSTKIWESYAHLYKGRNFWRQLEQYYCQHFSSDQQKLIATAEIYYAIAFAPTQRHDAASSVSVPLSQIKRAVRTKDGS